MFLREYFLVNTDLFFLVFAEREVHVGGQFFFFFNVVISFNFNFLS